MRIQGLIEGEPFELTYDDCGAVGEEHQVPDIGKLVPGREGKGLRFGALVDRAGPPLNARWVTIESDGGFAASLPIEEIVDDAIVVYAKDDAPLAEEDGGPFRLFIPGYRDACANVKSLASVTFADVPGRDTRPRDDDEACRSEATG